MTFRPLRDLLLAKRIPRQKMTPGGLHLPTDELDSAESQEAHVIAVGPGKRNKLGVTVPLQTKPGDRVLVGSYTCTEIVLDGEELIVVAEDKLLGVVA